jgi:hypothetical protein
MHESIRSLRSLRLFTIDTKSPGLLERMPPFLLPMTCVLKTTLRTQSPLHNQEKQAVLGKRFFIPLIELPRWLVEIFIKSYKITLGVKRVHLELSSKGEPVCAVGGRGERWQQRQITFFDSLGCGNQKCYRATVTMRTLVSHTNHLLSGFLQLVGGRSKYRTAPLTHFFLLHVSP